MIKYVTAIMVLSVSMLSGCCSSCSNGHCPVSGATVAETDLTGYEMHCHNGKCSLTPKP